ncbi:aldehyde dehydrogenase family protein [Reichenbachiella ulvae]|uniref:Aldehyde dehydrogenase family protein n=1 Tax=Reichenbachiella ulvae TaxID=2980104 RepID=A0ABT3CPK4_9BACT|nr:aldehyde dehydrogenase family protein [Reichenbachiella ulvae]MCV9385653.1 aldehyde dehydrogenase family protein [Reichenbachiella ulvae]
MAELKISDGYQCISPGDGQEKAFYPYFTDQDLTRALEEVAEGYQFLSKTSIQERKDMLYSIAAKIEERAGKLAKLVTEEMGKPITQSKAEIQKCADMARYHADQGEEWLKKEVVDTPQLTYEIHQEPLGPVLFISTWNNPFLQATLAIVPQLIIGNSVLAKPAPNAPRCILEMEKIVEELKLPAKIFVPVLTTIPQTEEILKNTDIKGVTFIGSTKAGRRVGSLAGESFKAAVIDAGGSDPMVVLQDADLEEAAKGAVGARFGNTGQSCVAAKRIIVHEAVYDDFMAAFILETKKLKVGDPMDEATTVGPLATHQARDLVKGQIEQSLSQGAELIYGGKVLEGSGAFIEPTILSNVNCDMLPSKEEVFGPVAAVYKVKSLKEAVDYANDTPYGLGASVYTKTPEKIVPLLETGNVAVNTKVATNFPVPFGGIKASGYGVYFGREGVTTFTNSKVVNIPK